MIIQRIRLARSRISRQALLRPRLDVAWWPLALILVLRGLMVLAAAIWPLSPQSDIPFLIGTGLALLLIAVAIALFRNNTATVPVAVALALVIVTWQISQAQTAVGAVLASFGLLYLTFYASYAFSGRALRLYVAGALVGPSYGMAVATPAFRPLTWLAIALSIGLSSVVVRHIMTGLRWYATTDELTGAITRHALWGVLDANLAAARRRGEPLTVAVVDLDDFKIINDTQGHAAGDKVLIEVVREWRKRLREQDVVGRTGGDEFVLAFPGTTLLDARELVHELQGAAPARWSAGIALAEPGDTVEELIVRADAELYRVKEARRQGLP